MVRCFKCKKIIKSAIINSDIWEMPLNAVVFRGGYNYGSSVYDSLVDGIQVEVIICDDCLRKNKNKSLIRNIKIIKTEKVEIVKK